MADDSKTRRWSLTAEDSLAVKILRCSTKKANAWENAATGVLVDYAGKPGMLTCAHVFFNHTDNGWAPRESMSYKIELESGVAVPFRSISVGPKNRDVAFVAADNNSALAEFLTTRKLPLPKVSTLEANLHFFDRNRGIRVNVCGFRQRSFYLFEARLMSAKGQLNAVLDGHYAAPSCSGSAVRDKDGVVIALIRSGSFHDTEQLFADFVKRMGTEKLDGMSNSQLCSEIGKFLKVPVQLPTLAVVGSIPPRTDMSAVINFPVEVVEAAVEAAVGHADAAPRPAPEQAQAWEQAQAPRSEERSEWDWETAAEADWSL
jgi:hypothetical protein